MTPNTNILEVRDLQVHFPIGYSLFRGETRKVYAVDGVSFDIGRGETCGLVGESGCGKSTVGRALARLIKPTAGTIAVNGKDIATLEGRGLREIRRDIQMVFQDPFSSLNPRMRVIDIIREPLKNFNIGTRAEQIERAKDLCAKVGLRQDHLTRLPHEFSGGQRQRIGIARALALQPKLIILDEPVSALDVSVQAQIVNLLTDLTNELGVSLLFVSHDLAVTRHISDRMVVMYLGKVVETGKRDQIFANPRHPYTRALLGSVLEPDPGLRNSEPPLIGEIPSPINPPPGCHFRTRCRYATEICAQSRPELRVIDGQHAAACHLVEQEYADAPL